MRAVCQSIMVFIYPIFNLTSIDCVAVGKESCKVCVIALALLTERPGRKAWYTRHMNHVLLSRSENIQILQSLFLQERDIVEGLCSDCLNQVPAEICTQLI